MSRSGQKPCRSLDPQCRDRRAWPVPDRHGQLTVHAGVPEPADVEPVVESNDDVPHLVVAQRVSFRRGREELGWVGLLKSGHPIPRFTKTSSSDLTAQAEESTKEVAH
jgi:hypothetical protein